MEQMEMMTRREVEIHFPRSRDAALGIVKLMKLGYEIEVLDLVDDDGGCWIMARIDSELDPEAFTSSMVDIVHPYGFVFVDRPQPHLRLVPR
jgi:hypothetical protein